MKRETEENAQIKKLLSMHAQGLAENDFTSRVMDRLPSEDPLPEKYYAPLFSRKQWFIAGMSALGLVVLLLIFPGEGGKPSGGYMEEVMRILDFTFVPTVFYLACTAIGVLVITEFFLSRNRAV